MVRVIKLANTGDANQIVNKLTLHRTEIVTVNTGFIHVKWMFVREDASNQPHDNNVMCNSAVRLTVGYELLV